MTKSICEVIADYYGMELNQPFKVRFKGSGRVVEVYFKEDGIYYLEGLNKSLTVLSDIVGGVAEIILPPFYPKVDEMYYYIAFDIVLDVYTVEPTLWKGSFQDFHNLNIKNVYRNRNEAEQQITVLKKNIEKVKEEYEANKCK